MTQSNAGKLSLLRNPFVMVFIHAISLCACIVATALSLRHGSGVPIMIAGLLILPVECLWLYATLRR